MFSRGLISKRRFVLGDSSRSAVVVGGSGLVGASIVKWLGTNGFQVKWTSREKLGSRFNHGTFLQLKPDSKSSYLEQELDGAGIIVFAAGLNEQECLDHPQLAFEVNGIWPGRVASAARKVGSVRKFIYVSTAKVYDDVLSGVICEETATQAKHAYGRSHLEGEKGINRTGQDNKMQSIALRVANVVGPPSMRNQRIEHLLPYRAASSAVKEKKIVLRGTGMAQRDFVTSSFLSRVIGELLRVDRFPPSGILNVASGRSVVIRDLVHQIADYASRATRSHVEVRLGSKDEENPKELKIETKYPEIWKAAGDNQLDASLQQMVSYYINQQNS